jgi:single-strand DNA-binding protein
MTSLRLPELNNVIIVGNLTRDPVFRKTNNETPVVNFSIASNRRYRDSNNLWQEEVCYVGIVAWTRLAESCLNRLKKGSAVLIEGELQSRTVKSDDCSVRTTVEIKARRIQFLNKKDNQFSEVETLNGSDSNPLETDNHSFQDDSFEKFLSHEDLQILKETNNEKKI